jgi:hypothetical protein
LTTISAKSILASRHALDPSKRIDTLLLRYPRWIHAEGRTHRLMKLLEGFEISLPTPSLMEDENLSRNASSSRAIPVERLIQDVLDDTAMPIFWGANQKGMQAGEECDEPVSFRQPGMARAWPQSKFAAWLYARDQAIEMARAFAAAGYHKQIVNRLLEPFSHITVVATATNWSNFLALRDHNDAEPHIHFLAQEIRAALDGAEVQTLQPGEWHWPFASDKESLDIVEKFVDEENDPCSEHGFENLCMKLSVARCASTSYKTVDGFDMTLERAIDLHDKLVASVPLHASPCEHQAKADYQVPVFEYSNGEVDLGFSNPQLSGNLGEGWIQYRKTLNGECQ